jgi:hypothetical protein
MTQIFNWNKQTAEIWLSIRKEGGKLCVRSQRAVLLTNPINLRLYPLLVKETSGLKAASLESAVQRARKSIRWLWTCPATFGHPTAQIPKQTTESKSESRKHRPSEHINDMFSLEVDLPQGALPLTLSRLSMTWKTRSSALQFPHSIPQLENRPADSPTRSTHLSLGLLADTDIHVFHLIHPESRRMKSLIDIPNCVVKKFIGDSESMFARFSSSRQAQAIRQCAIIAQPRERPNSIFAHLFAARPRRYPEDLVMKSSFNIRPGGIRLVVKMYLE